MGHDISYSTVCNYIKENLETKEAFIRQEYSLGETLEFDWGEKLKLKSLVNLSPFKWGGF